MDIAGSSIPYQASWQLPSAGEIVKLLPSLSPGLSHKLLQSLRESCDEWSGGVLELFVEGYATEKVLKEVCEGFAAELKALAGLGSGAAEQGARGGSDDDVIWQQQLSFCLLLALAPSLPNVNEIQVAGPDADHPWYLGAPTAYGYVGERAVEVLCSALVSQHWSNPVQRLTIVSHEGFLTDRVCVHLAHLLKSDHCKLTELFLSVTDTLAAGGMGLIARALQANFSLTVLNIDKYWMVGDGGVEQLAATLRTNSTLQELSLREVGMTAHGLRHLCDALQSTQQSGLQAISSSKSPTTGTSGGLKVLDIIGNKIGEGGAALLGAMLANNCCLRTLKVKRCSLGVDGEGHLAKGLRGNSTLENLDISWNEQLGKVALGLLVRCLATNNNTNLRSLGIGMRKNMPAAEELAHMIVSNHALEDLDLTASSYSAEEWATVILPALGRNKTLQSIHLGRSPGVGGEQVRAALLHLLRVNTTIQHIELFPTPLEESGEAEAVEEELGRNRQFRHALSALPRAKA